MQWSNRATMATEEWGGRREEWRQVKGTAGNDHGRVDASDHGVYVYVYVYVRTYVCMDECLYIHKSWTLALAKLQLYIYTRASYSVASKRDNQFYSILLSFLYSEYKLFILGHE